jgi:hypothetical protein
MKQVDQILGVMKAQGEPITTSVLAAATGLDSKRCATGLWRLVAEGRIKRIDEGKGPGKRAVYALLDGPDAARPEAALRGPWTDTVIADLRAKQALGWSAGECAKAMGMTRNQVIGKGKRLGLVFGGGKASTPTLPRPKAPPVKKLPNSVNNKIGVRIAKAKAPKPSAKILDLTAHRSNPVAAAAAPASPAPKPASIALAPRPWETRERGECEFTIGDGPFLSCCNPTAGRYCPEHRAILYQPTSKAKPYERSVRRFA